MEDGSISREWVLATTVRKYTTRKLFRKKFKKFRLPRTLYLVFSATAWVTTCSGNVSRLETVLSDDRVTVCKIGTPPDSYSFKARNFISKENCLLDFWFGTPVLDLWPKKVQFMWKCSLLIIAVSLLRSLILSSLLMIMIYILYISWGSFLIITWIFRGQIVNCVYL